MIKGLVSIIIPSYNTDKFIVEAIESALNQTYKHIEVIVVDDGSTDRTLSVIKLYTEKIILIKQKNKGGSSARNVGLRLANGEYIKYLDSDDILEKDAIRQQVRFSSRIKKNEIVFGDLKRINEDGQVIQNQRFNKNNLLKRDQLSFFILYPDIVTTCPLHRKENLDLIGGFDEKLVAGQEVDLHLRLVSLGISFVYQPIYIYRYRNYNSSSRISSFSWMKKRPDQSAYFTEKIESLIVSDNLLLRKLQTEALMQLHFNYARKYIRSNNDEKFKFHLSRIKSMNKNFIPSIHGFKFLGLLYKIIGYLIGYNRIEMMLQFIKR